VNDAITHVFFDALPFGGVGVSGRSHHHGEYGFRSLSHAKPVVLQSAGGGESIPLMRAPYVLAAGATFNTMIGA
jgi:coniferyl-aldehyde dehydrogenase